jgi:nitroimidazol reductase NimA-like FMN-containing flavoprotein (pyridoxamine 5'-phosphate oxidase superfamily)
MSTDEEFDWTAMDTEEVDAFLTEVGVGTLSLARDGVAYGVPVSFGYDPGDDRVFFAFLRGVTSRKERFVETTTEASLSVFEALGRHDWRSVVVAGPVRRATDDEDDAMERALANNAWHPDLFSGANPIRGIRGYVLDVDRATGYRS